MVENKSIDYFALVVAYLPFLIISLGLFGNTSAFLVFRFNTNLKKMSSMMILSFVVVVNRQLFKSIFIILLFNY